MSRGKTQNKVSYLNQHTLSKIMYAEQSHMSIHLKNPISTIYRTIIVWVCVCVAELQCSRTTIEQSCCRVRFSCCTVKLERDSTFPYSIRLEMSARSSLWNATPRMNRVNTWNAAHRWHVFYHQLHKLIKWNVNGSVSNI